MAYHFMNDIADHVLALTVGIIRASVDHVAAQLQSAHAGKVSVGCDLPNMGIQCVVVAVVVHAVRAEPHVTGAPTGRPGPDVVCAQCWMHLSRGVVVVTVVLHVIGCWIAFLGRNFLKATLRASSRCTARDWLRCAVVTHCMVLEVQYEEVYQSKIIQ